jgi:hypothetical protein
MNQNRKDITIDPAQLYSVLRGMIGKEYTYRNQQHRIIDVMEAGAGYAIETDKASLVIKMSNAAHFINECSPLENLPSQSKEFHNKPTSVQVMLKDESLLDELTDGLHAQFRKLQQNPSKGIIDQTQSMVDTSKAITDIFKLKLMAVKLLQKQD